MKQGVITILFFCVTGISIGQTIQPSKGIKATNSQKEEKGIETTAKPINASNTLQQKRTIDKVRLKKLPVKKEQEISEPLKND